MSQRTLEKYILYVFTFVGYFIFWHCEGIKNLYIHNILPILSIMHHF